LLIVDGGADAKAYNLPIGIGYDDSPGSRQEDVQRLSLMVRRRPELKAVFYREPESLAVGSPTSLSMELMNVGLSPVNVLQIRASSPEMRVEAEGTPHVGPVEVGGSAPLDVSVTPHETGVAHLIISVTYRDDFNQPQVLSSTLEVEVAGGPGGPIAPGLPAAPSAAPEERVRGTVWSTIARVLRGFFGFGS
jgi:hypothetical protein